MKKEQKNGKKTVRKGPGMPVIGGPGKNGTGR
jgi:hypothetical protein